MIDGKYVIEKRFGEGKNLEKQVYLAIAFENRKKYVIKVFMEKETE